MIKKYLSSLAVITAVLGFLLIATPAFAQSAPTATSPGNSAWGHSRGGPKTGMMRPGVFGTVSAVDVGGNTNIITVTSTIRQRPASGTTTTAPTPAPTVFTVDATNATVMKNNATSTISAIAVGDNVAIQGTISGTNVTATMIRDGVMQRPTGAGQKQPVVLNPGNGQPVVAGAVNSVSGNTIMITNKSNVSYTIDATNAKIQKGSASGTISSIAVGDNLVVQGATNGNSVTASTIIDQTKPANATGTGATSSIHNFFGGIGNFFSKLFGF